MNTFFMLTAACIALVPQVVLAAGSEILEEIAVRGQQEAPNQESISIREVRESSARDVGEALKRVEGMSYVRKGAIANDVVLRGFQRDNINVLVDGVRLHGACPSRMDPPAFHYDFAEIEEVRVLKGPYDLSNPGGLGGTVEARTKSPGPGAGGSAALTCGSWNSVNGSATASYGADAWDGLLGYAYKYSDVPEAGNGRRLTEIYPATSPNRYRNSEVDSKAYEINTGWGKLGFRPTEKSRAEVGYSFQDADHVLYPYLKMDAEYDRTHRLNLTYRIPEPSPLLRNLELQGYWDRVSHLMHDRLRASSLTTPRPYSMQTDATTQTWGVKVKASLAAGPGTVRAGADYYHRNWDALNRRAGYFSYRDLAMVPDATLQNAGLFAEYRLPLGEATTLRGGVRGDLAWAEAGKGNTQVASGFSRRFADVSANLELSYTPLAGLELFGGVARGTRTPDQQELFLDVPVTAPSAAMNYWHGNRDLDATVNHQADLGARFSTRRFYANASLFYSDLTDYINFEQVPGTFEKSYRNVHASMWGGELGSQLSLENDLYLRGSFSYVRGRNESGDRPLAEIPPMRGTAALRYDDGTWFLEVAENLAARQDRVDRALSESQTPGWATTDLKAGASYGRFTVNAGIENLFDREYYSHLSYARDPFQGGVKVPENGRYLYLAVTYAL